LQDRLEHAIAHAHRSHRLVAVMFLDLDRFKLINDSFGHKSGDQLLQIMASRLQQIVREGDTVARLGGDEFVILLEDLAAADGATRIAEKVLAQLSVPVWLNKHQLVISTSIGISVYRDNESAGTLLKEADIAMYQAKEKGGNEFHYFDAEMNLRVFERLLMENGLRRALEHEEIVLHYQPFVDLKTGRIVGMEALARWEHPEKGLLGPNEFIFIAEETGLINALGESVLRAACKQQQAWCEQGLSGPRMSVNLSAKQFGPRNLVKMIRSILDETGMEPSLLKLEITETGLMQDVTRAKDTLLELAAMGIELAIDDFGTGYSSLSYLKTLPIDTLKVDRSFVNDVAVDPDDAAIVRATIGLAHHMGLRVIAEGVETPKQLSFLALHQCDEGQGYYFSPPLAPNDMEALLRTGKPFPVSFQA
jgi:diguanylate cyclase (GGDEF)-like protein